MTSIPDDVKKLVDRALWLANGQDDPHSQTIIELCAALLSERNRAREEALNEAAELADAVADEEDALSITDEPDRVAEHRRGEAIANQIAAAILALKGKPDAL